MSFDREEPWKAMVSPILDYGRTQRLIITHDAPSGNRYRLCNTVQFVQLGEMPPEEAEIEILESGLGQSLIDELWKAGYRPTGPENELTEGVAATKRHLEDMRAIAFHTVKAPKP